MFLPRQRMLLRWWMWDFLSYRNLRFHTIKTLRADRTAAEWKNVACATRRRRRILLRRILFYRKRIGKEALLFAPVFHFCIV